MKTNESAQELTRSHKEPSGLAPLDELVKRLLDDLDAFESSKRGENAQQVDD